MVLARQKPPAHHIHVYDLSGGSGALPANSLVMNGFTNPLSKHESARAKKEQSRKFIEATDELGREENESAFDEIARQEAKGTAPRQEKKPKTRKRQMKA